MGYEPLPYCWPIDDWQHNLSRPNNEHRKLRRCRSSVSLAATSRGDELVGYSMEAFYAHNLRNDSLDRFINNMENTPYPSTGPLGDPEAYSTSSDVDDFERVLASQCSRECLCWYLD